MKTRNRNFRMALAATLFSVAMGFGAFQAFASGGAQSEQASCNAWACRQECGALGGNLGPGGPGKPLRCYCCG